MEITPELLYSGAGWYVVFLFSLVFHEAAHGFIALKLGDRTAYHNGQVSLEPLPHIRQEPMGTVVFPIISFLLNGWMMGWASVPYDRQWARRYPRRNAWMSLAGPAANFTLVVVAGLLIRLGMAAGWFNQPDTICGFMYVTRSNAGGVAYGLAILLSITFSLNLILTVFNLLPLPPMDGTGWLLLLLEDRKARGVMDFISQPYVSLFGLITAWHFFDYLFDPVFSLALGILYPGSHYR